MSQNEQINPNIIHSGKKRISTPALLFCRSSSRSPTSETKLTANNRSSSMSTHNCQNHPHKNAGYLGQTQQDDQLYYCQRCAILLASQGFPVKRLSTNATTDVNMLRHSRKSMSSKSIKAARENQVEGFLTRIQDFIKDIGEKNLQIRDKLVASQEFYGQQIEQINDYFQTIYQSLELEKNKCYNIILNERKEVEDPVRIVRCQIEGLKQELQQISEDIEENIEAVFEIDESSYRPVILEYQDKLAQFEERFSEIRLHPIEMRKIEFAGVPEQIYSLSEIILRNSTERISVEEIIDKNRPTKQGSGSLVFSFDGQQQFRSGKSDQLQLLDTYIFNNNEEQERVGTQF